MQVKSNTPATPKATAPKKRRTRKTSQTAKVDKVIKEIQEVLDTPNKVTVTTFKGGKAVAKKTTRTRPSTARLITWERYQKDISTRWAIHQFEIQELIKDLTKAIDFFQPYHTELVKRVKAVNL